MSFSWAFQWYHFHLDPIWPDGTFQYVQKLLRNIDEFEAKGLVCVIWGTKFDHNLLYMYLWINNLSTCFPVPKYSRGKGVWRKKWLVSLSSARKCSMVRFSFKYLGGTHRWATAKIQESYNSALQCVRCPVFLTNLEGKVGKVGKVCIGNVRTSRVFFLGRWWSPTAWMNFL